MSVKTDRRTQSRKRPLSLVYVELPPSNGGMLRDLNEQGFALRAMMALHLSEKLPFSISLDNGVRIDGEAIVVRLEDNGHVAALEFAGLAAHSRDQIRRWLEKFEEPLSREAWAPKPPAVRASTMEELRHEARKVVAEPPAQHAEPVVAPPEPEPEPPAPMPQLKQLPEHEPPSSLPPAPQAAPPVVPPSQEIALVPPPPPPVTAPTEVAPVLPQEQLEFPSQLVTEPPAPTLDAPVEQPFESAELPLPKFLRQPEHAPPPPPAAQLPPLLKLSSVRPGPPPEPPKEPVFPVPNSRVAEAPPAPNPVPLSEILIQPPSVIAAPPSPPALAPAHVPSRVVPPPLEPLSAWESETDAASPGWTESFTLGRAIGIMVFLALLVGSVVYHREVGHALIWLGQQIAGEEPQEASQITQPFASPVVATPAAPANSPNPTNPPEKAATAAEDKSAATPPAPENPVVPQTDANRTPEAAPADSTSGTGQDEYQRAMQILKTPSRKAELPEAVRLLWIAVKKNNVGAEITLAELYHQGRGVAKSCEQTKILLSAAARKGSPDARRRLQEFQREGCHN